MTDLGDDPDGDIEGYDGAGAGAVGEPEIEQEFADIYTRRRVDGFSEHPIWDEMVAEFGDPRPRRRGAPFGPPAKRKVITVALPPDVNG